MTDSKMPEPVACKCGKTPRHLVDKAANIQKHIVACDCGRWTILDYPTKQEAIGAWNRLTRPDPVADAELEALVNDLWDSVAANSLTSRAARTITALRARTAQPVGVQQRALDRMCKAVRRKDIEAACDALDAFDRALLPEGGAHEV